MMTKIYQMRALFLSTFFAIFVGASAQDFKWQANLPGVTTNGFYKILVSPEITSKLENGFSDIRIYNSDNKEVPYIYESEQPLSYSDYFVEYAIIEKKEQTEWPYYTRLIIHNPKRSKISNIQLIIRNSDVSKSLKLSGSDDKRNWYIIKDAYRFHAMYSDEATSVIKIIDFPVSNYEYYEILIDDWKNNPINIQKAGYFNTSVEEGKYTAIEPPEISQLELKEEKQSLVKIVYQGKQQIDKITFKIKGPEFFFREAEIQVRDSVKNKRKEYEYFFQTIDHITLSSNSLNSWYFKNLRSGVLYLRIKNNDNEPLKISGAEAEQLNSYLISKLEKGISYSIKFGDKNLVAANYDLKYFKDEVPARIDVIKVTGIKSLKTVVTTETETGIHLNSAFIWVAIIAVVLLLLYMVTKMMKDMKADRKS